MLVSGEMRAIKKSPSPDWWLFIFRTKNLPLCLPVTSFPGAKTATRSGGARKVKEEFYEPYKWNWVWSNTHRKGYNILTFNVMNHFAFLFRSRTRKLPCFMEANANILFIYCRDFVHIKFSKSHKMDSFCPPFSVPPPFNISVDNICVDNFYLRHCLNN